MELIVNKYHYSVSTELIPILKKTFLSYDLSTIGHDSNNDKSSININLSTDHDLPSIKRIIDYLLKVKLSLGWDLNSQDTIINQLYELKFCSIDSSLYFDYPDFDPFNYPPQVTNLYWNKKEFEIPLKSKVEVFSYERERTYFAYFDSQKQLILYSYSNQISYRTDYQKSDHNDAQYYLVEKNSNLYLIKESFHETFHNASRETTFNFYQLIFDSTQQEIGNKEIINKETKLNETEKGKESHITFKVEYKTSFSYYDYIRLNYNSFVNFPSLLWFEDGNNRKQKPEKYLYTLFDAEKLRSFKGEDIRDNFIFCPNFKILSLEDNRYSFEIDDVMLSFLLIIKILIRI